MASTASALPYHEPGIVTILILASFLLLQNAINWAFDRLLFCGLIGQIAIGVAWGTPGAKWLPDDVQHSIVQLGYLGLILLVFEGGLSTDLKALKSNLHLSSLVALVGISAPIGLSFALPAFVQGTTPVQAFAAGAALCSTSLGTTFTILSTSGLGASRLGVVLSSAAMMDDIVGLVMSGIISRLGGASKTFSASTVVRPVLVSIAFAVLLPPICLFVFKPLTKLCYGSLVQKRGAVVRGLLVSEGAAVFLHTLVLVALVAAASYAGTSVLFAAYLAGVAITWWDGLCGDLRRANAGTQQTAILRTPPPENHGEISPEERAEASKQHEQTDTPERRSMEIPDEHEHLTGTHIFEKFYEPALRTILKPFFFASIGFAIPISNMFTGSIVWRGLVYTIIMLIAKLACGLCLIRLSTPLLPTQALKKILQRHTPEHLPWPFRTRHPAATNPERDESPPQTSPVATADRSNDKNKSKVPRVVSLYPAAMLGSAMVARGEIGFLISSVAESEGIFGEPGEGGSSELYLVVTWAILLCTLLGPIAIGTLTKRVRRLQALERSKKTGRPDPLGMWGVTAG